MEESAVPTTDQIVEARATNVIAIRRNGQSYVFLYDGNPESYCELGKVIGRFMQRSDLDFSREDVQEVLRILKMRERADSKAAEPKKPPAAGLILVKLLAFEFLWFICCSIGIIGVLSAIGFALQFSGVTR